MTISVEKFWTIAEKTAPAIGVISLIGAIATGLWGNLAASLIMLALTGVLFVTWYVSKDKSSRIRLFREELEISSATKNLRQMDSSFLSWPKCSIMVWVLVPPQGQGLRDAPNYRYLFAHITNDPREMQQCNLFALRYTPHKHWEVAFTNDQAQFAPGTFVIPDGLQPGWHHFFIAWDHSKPELIFRIDDGRGGENYSKSYLSYWPKRQADKVTIGAWVTTDPYSASYCDTHLFELRIYNGFLGSTDVRFSEHIKLKMDMRA